MAKEITREIHDTLRNTATQVDALYVEIDKLAKKKPGEYITSLISRKINHVIKKTKEIISNDDFLDAIETVPNSDIGTRFDEALIILGELKSVSDRQWKSDEWKKARDQFKTFYENVVL